MKNQSSLVQKGNPPLRTWLWLMGLCAAVLAVPDLALAASPFTTGATGLSTNLLAIFTPIAVIMVMALGIAAAVNKISWGWCVGAVIGIALIFGAQQIITWVRGMFGV
ncbi:MAG: TrbC/VirB2 family protein [Pseudomonadota bacterium]|nr:TrbC/VirB2 family protein [Pseudomonadota bacterium]